MLKTCYKSILSEFLTRYWNIQNILLNHFKAVEYSLTDDDKNSLSSIKRLLIGAYFTMEYSIEAAALFVEDADQRGAGKEQKK